MNSIAKQDQLTLGIGQNLHETHQNGSAGGRSWPLSRQRSRAGLLRILRTGINTAFNSITVRNWRQGELNITLAPDKAALSAPSKGDTRAPWPSAAINDMTWRRAA